MRWLSRLALVAFLLAMGLPALPCSCMEPDGRFLVSGHVLYPENAFGVPWWGYLGVRNERFVPPDSSLFEVEEWDGSAWRAIPFDLVPMENEFTQAYQKPRDPMTLFLVRPKGGFEPDARYHFRFAGRGTPAIKDGKDFYDKSFLEVVIDVSRDSCEAKSNQAEVNLGDHSYGEIRTSTRGGTCSTTFRGDRQTISMQLPGDWARWADALLYTVDVRGVGNWRPDRSLCDPTPPGSSSVGRGQEMLFTHCEDKTMGIYREVSDPESSLPPGRYKVEFTAWLPGTLEKVTASTEVEMTCNSR